MERPTKYRFRLPSGEVYLINEDKLAWGKREYATAHIDVRLTPDAGGAYSEHPYQGKQPYEAAEAAAEAEAASEEAEAPDYEARTMTLLRDEIEDRGLDQPAADAKKADLIAILESDDQTERDEEGG